MSSSTKVAPQRPATGVKAGVLTSCCLFLLLLLLLPVAVVADATKDLDCCKADMVLIKKSERKLLLMQNGEVYREYRISLGKNPSGSKERQGDSRTPEGGYVLDWRNNQSSYYKSIHISYPSQEDVASAKSQGADPGGMIMIHGTPNKQAYPTWLYEEMDWTDGCIAVNNEAMDEIWNTVADGTPIKIAP